MDRILCGVRAWTDGSCRGVSRTPHKMNWTKPLGRRGRPLADLKHAAAGIDGAGGTLDVHFISLLPVRQRNAYKAWGDSRHVQSVAAEGYTRLAPDVAGDGFG